MQGPGPAGSGRHESEKAKYGREFRGIGTKNVSAGKDQKLFSSQTEFS